MLGSEFIRQITPFVNAEWPKILIAHLTVNIIGYMFTTLCVSVRKHISVRSVLRYVLCTAVDSAGYALVMQHVAPSLSRSYHRSFFELFARCQPKILFIFDVLGLCFNSENWNLTAHFSRSINKFDLYALVSVRFVIVRSFQYSSLWIPFFDARTNISFARS